MDVKELVEEQFPYIVALRRHFHQEPEPSTQERRTSDRVARELEAMGIPCERLEHYGVVGHIHGTGPGKVLALRADMDALLMEETAPVPFRSRRTGVMHACGHDAHTASLLGAARVLSRLTGRFRGEVRLLFQPAEEVCLGARGMINAGALDGVDTIFGMHVDLSQPAGKLDLTPGVRTCAATRFQFRFQPTGEVGPSPAVTAAADAILALQTIASREISPTSVFALSCCQVGSGGEDRPNSVTVEGTCRFSDLSLRETLGRRMERILGGIAAAHGVAADLELEYIAYPLVNDEAACAQAQESAAKLFGPECLVRSGTASVSEDFAEYLQVVPGAYGQLGANLPDMSLTLPNHNPGFCINERALFYGASLFVRYALDVLA